MHSVFVIFYLRDIQRQEGDTSALGLVLTAGDLVNYLPISVAIPQGSSALYFEISLVDVTGIFVVVPSSHSPWTLDFQ